MPKNTCTFCSETARVEYTGRREAIAGKQQAAKETVFACWRSQHKTKTKAYLHSRAMDEIAERQL